MKLKPKEKELKPKHVRLTAPGQLYADLQEYADYYATTYKDKIEITELMIEMTAQFIKADTGFRRWRTGQEEPESSQESKPNGSRLQFGQSSSSEDNRDASQGH